MLFPLEQESELMHLFNFLHFIIIIIFIAKSSQKKLGKKRG